MNKLRDKAQINIEHIAARKKYLRCLCAMNNPRDVKKKRNSKNSLKIKGKEIAEYFREDAMSTM